MPLSKQEISARYYLRHRDRLLENRKKQNKENPQWGRKQTLKKYGLDSKTYDKMLQDQGGVCKICQGPQDDGKHLFVDHNHKTGVVRGLLCRKCNTAVGFMRDDLMVVSRMMEYLKCDLD